MKLHLPSFAELGGLRPVPRGGRKEAGADGRERDCEPLALQAQPAVSGPRRSAGWAGGSVQGALESTQQQAGEELRTTAFL